MAKANTTKNIYVYVNIRPGYNKTSKRKPITELENKK
jgi:hypothetical protein